MALSEFFGQEVFKLFGSRRRDARVFVADSPTDDRSEGVVLLRLRYAEEAAKELDGSIGVVREFDGDRRAGNTSGKGLKGNTGKFIGTGLLTDPVDSLFAQIRVAT